MKISLVSEKKLSYLVAKSKLTICSKHHSELYNLSHIFHSKSHFGDTCLKNCKNQALFPPRCILHKCIVKQWFCLFVEMKKLHMMSQR